VITARFGVDMPDRIVNFAQNILMPLWVSMKRGRKVIATIKRVAFTLSVVTFLLSLLSFYSEVGAEVFCFRCV
jgi:hypothetical protein